MLTCAMIALTLLSTGQDVTSIPADQRITYYNKLADRLTGENAADHYARAKAAFVPIWELSNKRAQDEKTRAAFEHLDINVYAYAMLDRWNSGQTAAVRAWIKANSSVSPALTSAARRDRCFRPLDPGEGRLHGVAIDFETDPLNVGLVPMCKLAWVVANNFAMQDNWDAAYAWNLRTHNIADHFYQQPLSLQELIGMAIERPACQQLLNFIRRHPPEDLDRLLNEIGSRDEWRCPGELREHLELLWTRDFIEVWHEWANDPGKHPDLTESAEFLFGSDGLDFLAGDLLADVFGTSPYKNVEELRSALQRSTVDDEWKILHSANELYRTWADLPFHQAWTKVDDFERRFCEVYLKGAALSIHGCGQLATSQQRLFREETTMLRTVVACVVAIHQYRNRHHRLPTGLKELTPQFMDATPIDPYSGKPLIYRITDGGRDFILYSAGSDQDDDGGRHTGEMREPGDRVFWPPPPVPLSDG